MSAENRGLLMREDVTLTLTTNAEESADEALTIEVYRAVIKAINPTARLLHRVTIMLLSDSPHLAKLVTYLRGYGVQVRLVGARGAGSGEGRALPLPLR